MSSRRSPLLCQCWCWGDCRLVCSSHRALAIQLQFICVCDSSFFFFIIFFKSWYLCGAVIQLLPTEAFLSSSSKTTCSLVWLLVSKLHTSQASYVILWFVCSWIYVPDDEVDLSPLFPPYLPCKRCGWSSHISLFPWPWVSANQCTINMTCVTFADFLVKHPFWW